MSLVLVKDHVEKIIKVDWNSATYIYLMFNLSWYTAIYWKLALCFHLALRLFLSIVKGLNTTSFKEHSGELMTCY